jgi:hypothetical protein
MSDGGMPIKLKGFFQGSEVGPDGHVGAIKSFIQIENTSTKAILNVEISDESLKKVLVFTYPEGAREGTDTAESSPEVMEPQDEPEEIVSPRAPDDEIPSDVFGN